MADTKISALPSGNPAANGDLIPIDRAGSNFKISVGSIANLKAGPTLQTDGVNNGSQSLLDLVGSGSVTVSDDGVGSVTINGSLVGAIGVSPGATTSADSTGSSGPTTIFTNSSGASINYLLNFYIGVVSAGAGGSTITVSVSWNDGTAKTRTIVNALPADATTSSASVSALFFIPTGTSLSITITSAGAAHYAFATEPYIQFTA